MLKIADEEHPDGLGFVYLWLMFAGGTHYYTVNEWICGEGYTSLPFSSEAEARRDFDQKRKEMLYGRTFAA